MIERNQEEYNYLQLLKAILERGSERKDRTGVGTLSLFGTRLRFDLSDGKVPLLTTKRMFTKGIIEELLFFVRGDTDTKKLEAKGVNIWKGNTSRDFLDKRGLKHLPEGSMGKSYSFQWRKSGAFSVSDTCKRCDQGDFLFENPGVDQIANLIDGLKNDPYGRRHIVDAWNPSQLDEMPLPPCHMMFQCYVDNGELSLQWYQRSVDSFLGLPFNIMSYAILTKLLAEVCDLKAKEVVFVGGDTHIYSNHIEQVKEQISREPYNFPTMKIKSEIVSLNDIENMSHEDFELVDYKYHPSIKAEMAI